MHGPTRMLRSPPSPRASGWGMLAPKPSVVGLIFRGKSRPTSEIVAHPGTDHLPRRDRDRGLLLGSRSSGVGGLAGGAGGGHQPGLRPLRTPARRGAGAVSSADLS